MNRSIVDQMKAIAKGVMDAARPADISIGIVSGTNPLKVTVEQRFTLSAAFLYVPESLSEYKVSIGGQEIVIRRGLEVGDKLAMIRAHGGQRYLIMDRVV